MPQQSWSAKRERQYEHIKEGLRDQGRTEGLAEEIAARTVNKERARSGESRQASRTSVRDISSSQRGGQRSHSGSGGRTKEQLYQGGQAQKHQGPFVDDQGSARTRRRALTGAGQGSDADRIGS